MNVALAFRRPFVALLLSAIGFAHAEASDPITVLGTFHFRSGVTPNTLGVLSGDVLTFGGDFTPNPRTGDTGTGVKATQVGVPSPGIITVPYLNSPAVPNQFATSVPYDAALSGAWTLTVTNPGSSNSPITMDTPTVGAAAIPKFIRGFNLEGAGSTPKFNWTLHDLSQDSQTLFISQRLTNGAVQIVHLEVLTKDTTSYQVEETLSGGGTLEVGRQYWVSINLDSRRPTDGTLLSRARSIIEFVPQATAPEKPIHLPYTGPDGVFRFDIPDVGSFEILIDPPVVSGYDYAIGVGDPNFASVRLPAVGDGIFTVSFFSGSVRVQERVVAGEVFEFPQGGVAAFRVRGIEESAGIDPANVTAFVTGLTFVTEGAFTGTMTPITDAGPLLTALSPAQVWIGLKNSDDVGTRLDILAEVYKDNTLVGSGQVNGVAGGSSSFNNARLSAIPLALMNAPIVMPPGTVLSFKLSARITCEGKTHAAGTARLWFDDAQARSRFGVTIDGVSVSEFLRKDLALNPTQGSGPKLTIDKRLDNKTPCVQGRPFTPFGEWSTALP